MTRAEHESIAETLFRVTDVPTHDTAEEGGNEDVQLGP
jgi:hypothetical protein